MTIFWRFGIARRLLISPLLLAAICLSLLSMGAAAQQSVDSIVDAAVTASKIRAQQHGYDTVAVEVRKLDPRLRLPLCQAPLSTSIAPTSQVLGAVSVGVGCNGAKPWTIYVRSHVTAKRTVPVLARPLARHAVISEDDLKFIEQPLNGSNNGQVDNIEQLVGMQLTRALDAGSVLRVAHLRKPNVIKRGQHVTIVSGTGGLEVRIQGKALADAANGERVAVSNISSGKRVEGIAHSDGTVSVQ